MSYSISIAPSAEADLDEAYFWWAKHRSAEQAGRWYREALAAIETLKSMPERCPLCEEADLRQGELRQLLYGTGKRATHRIVFFVEADLVNIVRVRHVAQPRLDELE